MSLAERRWLRLFTLTLLFFAQGVPWGFMAIALPAYLAQRGLDAAGVGSIVAMTTLPYAFKWVWGPAVDAFTIPRLGRRRPWILFSQLMMAGSLAMLLAIGDPLASFDLLLVVIFVHTTFNAMQNVAVDALAIDLLDPAERGRANGLMYGAKYAGGAVGAAGMGNVIERWSLDAAVVVQVAILLAITLVPLLVEERSGPPPQRAPLREVVRGLRDAFRLRATQLTAGLMLVVNLAGGMLSAVAPVLFMQHLHWDQDVYSDVAGGPGLAIGLLGSVLAGFAAEKIGPRKLAALASTVMATGWLVFALGEAWWMNRSFVYGLFAIEPLAQSVMIVSLWTLCMETTLKRTAATQFAAYTSLINLSSTVGAKLLGGTISGWLAYRNIYLLAAVMQVATIAVLPFIRSRDVEVTP